jgi:hypothetical protein
VSSNCRNRKILVFLYIFFLFIFIFLTVFVLLPLPFRFRFFPYRVVSFSFLRENDTARHDGNLSEIPIRTHIVPLNQSTETSPQTTLPFQYHGIHGIQALVWRDLQQIILKCYRISPLVVTLGWETRRGFLGTGFLGFRNTISREFLVS